MALRGYGCPQLVRPTREAGLTPFYLEFGREPVMPEEVGVQGHPLPPFTKENYAEALLQSIEQGRKA